MFCISFDTVQVMQEFVHHKVVLTLQTGLLVFLVVSVVCLVLFSVPYNIVLRS